MAVLGRWGRFRVGPTGSTSEALYKGILHRVPSATERLSLEYEVIRHGDIAAIADDMITSEEFTIMRLPNLMANASRMWCGRYLFFMHVPKTAGTSFRMALIHSAGIPAVTTYRHIGELDPVQFSSIAFWPLFIGHTHIDYFPEPHRGLTVVREPRSRYLSMYRQQQNAGRGPHLKNPAEKARLEAQTQAALSMSFGDWLRARPRASAASFFASGFPDRGERFVRSAPAHEVRTAVTAGASRIDVAAWAHDRQGMLRAISSATGDEDPKLPELNIFKPRSENSPEMITAADRSVLDECASRDQLLINALVARGLIEPLSSSQSDDLFQATAARLGFQLA